MVANQESDAVKTFIVVEPISPGWRVRSTSEEDLHFLHGSHAEAQARRLGLSHAAVGHDATVEIHDRNDAVVGSIHFYCTMPLAKSGAYTSS